MANENAALGDIHTDRKFQPAMDPASISTSSAAQNGLDIDTIGFRHLCYVLVCGNISAGSCTATTQDSTTGGGSGYNTVSGASAQTLTAAVGSTKTYLFPVLLDAKNRFHRLILTPTSATMIYAAGAILSDPQPSALAVSQPASTGVFTQV